MPQRPVSETHQPDTGVRPLCPETLRRDTGCVGEGVVAAVNVDGNDLTAVVGFDQGPNFPLVYLLAKAGGFFFRASWRGNYHDSLQGTIAVPLLYTAGQFPTTQYGCGECTGNPWCASVPAADVPPGPRPADRHFSIGRNGFGGTKDRYRAVPAAEVRTLQILDAAPSSDLPAGRLEHILSAAIGWLFPWHSSVPLQPTFAPWPTPNRPVPLFATKLLELPVGRSYIANYTPCAFERRARGLFGGPCFLAQFTMRTYVYVDSFHLY